MLRVLCVAEKPAIAAAIAAALREPGRSDGRDHNAPYGDGPYGGDRERDEEDGGGSGGDVGDSGGGRGRPRHNSGAHTFVSPFEGRQALFTVTSVRGHVFTTDFPA